MERQIRSESHLFREYVLDEGAEGWVIGVVLGTKIFGLEEGLKSVLGTLYLRPRKRTDIDD